MIIIIFALSTLKLYSQNLIQNGSFEEHVDCPKSNNNLALSDNWYSPTLFGTPDYFNACDTFELPVPKNFKVALPDGSINKWPKVSHMVWVPKNFVGHQEARNGVAYAGFYFTHDNFLNREYLQQKMKLSLVKGKTYVFRMQISFADKAKYSLNQVNVCISKKAPKTIKKLVPEIQIPEPVDYLSCPYKNKIEIKSDTVWDNKEQWVEINGEYIAKGGEQYITIGLFDKSITEEEWAKLAKVKNVTDAAYYYIDDVVLEEKKEIRNAKFNESSTQQE